MGVRKLNSAADDFSLAKWNEYNPISENKGRVTAKKRLRNTGHSYQRRFRRFTCLMVADYVTDNQAYRDFVCNLSASGAFFYTRNQFSIGQKLVFVLSPAVSGCYRTTATVVRTAPNGVAIEFNKPIMTENNKAVFQPLLAGVAGQHKAYIA